MSDATSASSKVASMITWFHVTGGHAYVDPYGVATGYEDVFTKLEAAAKHCRALGRGGDHAQRFVR